MRENIQILTAELKADKLQGSLAVCWIATVFSSFFGPKLFPITLPAVGTIFLFRILLPITTVLYILYIVRKKKHIWRDASSTERWCYILIAAMLIYSVVSLLRALDFMYTFRRLFNLCFDLCFFFLLLRMCRNKQMRKATLLTCAVSTVILFLLGVFQILTAAPYDSATNSFSFFFFLNGVYMSPDVGLTGPNDYAAGMAFISAIFLLTATASWKKVEKGGYWTAAICLPLLYFLTVADRARLVSVGFWILMAGFTMFLLISDRKRLWIPLVSIVLIGGVWFGTQYRYIMPSIQGYITQLEEYRQQEETGTSTPPPKLQIQTEPAQSLDKQFFAVNEETGEKVLREDSSGGVRARLLVHAFNCFLESHGLGVGLGNTETLAPRRNIVPEWAGIPQNSIHCFVIRIIADYGIFVLIPLCVVALLLLKSIWGALCRGWELQNTALIAWTLLYFAVLVTFPFLSTASSDSQDMSSMWIYLGFVVVISVELSALGSENRPGAEKDEARC